MTAGHQNVNNWDCLECKKAKYVERTQNEVVEIKKGPTVEVESITRFVCPECGDYLITGNESVERQRKIGAELMKLDLNNHLHPCPSCKSKEVEHTVYCGDKICIYIPQQCEDCGYKFKVSVSTQEIYKLVNT